MLSIRLILLLLNIKIISSCMQTSSSSSPTATDTSTTTSTASSATTSTSTSTSTTTTTALTTTTTTPTTTSTTTTTTTTTTLACASCTAGQVTLMTGTPANGMLTPTAGAITFDANGCANLPVTCTSTGNVVLIEFNNGANGTDGPAQGTITSTLVCNAGGIWTFMGQNIAITSVDCVSAAG